MIAPNKDFPIYLPVDALTKEEYDKLIDSLTMPPSVVNCPCVIVYKPEAKSIKGFPIVEGEKLSDSEAKDIAKAIKKLKDSGEWH